MLKLDGPNLPAGAMERLSCWSVSAHTGLIHNIVIFIVHPESS